MQVCRPIEIKILFSIWVAGMGRPTIKKIGHVNLVNYRSSLPIEIDIGFLDQYGDHTYLFSPTVS